jgi:hypothetical protein
MIKKIEYYNLNIKLNNKLKLDKSIQLQNLFNAAHNLEKMNRAPIFFGHYEHEDYINAKKNKKKLGEFNTKQLNEACEFINLYKENKEARIITIGDEKIWIYKIKSQIKNGKIEFNKFRQKYYDIEIIKHPKIEDVPYILATMKTNQAFSRNTFRKIDEKKYEANIAAIKSLIGELNDFKIDPLKTLSSVQLETLIAKIFEKNNAFIPAWRGGTLKDIDIIAEFEKNIPDNLFKVKVQGKKIKIQVKIQLNDKNNLDEIEKNLKKPNFFLITAEIGPLKEFEKYHEENYLTSKWINQQINSCDEIRNWFEKCIEWLPIQNRKKCYFNKNIN